MTGDLARVLGALSHRFGLDLDSSPLTEAEQGRVFPGSKFRPEFREQNKRTKSQIREVFESAVPSDLIEQAHAVRQEVLALRPTRKER